MDDDTPPPDDHYPPEDQPRRDNLPPQDVDAERAVLGAMMVSRAAIDDVVAVLRTGADFYRPTHETIWNTILDLYGRGETPDMLTVGAALRETGDLVKVGGAAYLHTLVESAQILSNAASHAEIVAEMAVRRRMVAAGARVAQWAQSGEQPVADLIDAAQAELFAATQRATTQDYLAIGEFLTETLDQVESAAAGADAVGAVPTGFYDLDDLTGGLHPGQMIVVAGRPAMGKSTLAIDFVRSASIQHNLTSAVFSLEMGRHEIAMRMIAAQAKVPFANLRSGKVNDAEWNKIALALNDMASAPLYVDDSPNLTMTEIRAKARRMKQTVGLDLVVIDYLQLMTSGKRVESRQQEVSEFSRLIKLLAKELDVPIVALSQLNRGPEQRADKRPMMSDLRESGSIEQDSDVVILLHREDAYQKEPTRPGEADLIVAKHRNGATRDIVVAFQGHYSRFVDMAQF